MFKIGDKVKVNLTSEELSSQCISKSAHEYIVDCEGKITFVNDQYAIGVKFPITGTWYFTCEHLQLV